MTFINEIVTRFRAKLQVFLVINYVLTFYKKKKLCPDEGDIRFWLYAPKNQFLKYAWELWSIIIRQEFRNFAVNTISGFFFFLEQTQPLVLYLGFALIQMCSGYIWIQTHKSGFKTSRNTKSCNGCWIRRKNNIPSDNTLEPLSHVCACVCIKYLKRYKLLLWS